MFLIGFHPEICRNDIYMRICMPTVKIHGFQIYVLTWLSVKIFVSMTSVFNRCVKVKFE